MLACTLAGVTPVDSPFFDVRDADSLAREAAGAAAFGFAAKAAIHPGQVAPIDQALTLHVSGACPPRSAPRR